MTTPAPASFKNVEVLTKANVYFDGNVVSHKVVFADGTKKTLGLIFPGTFRFDTDAPELMQIVAGTCRARLTEGGDWMTYEAGTEFRVAGKSAFDIAVDSGIAEYICSFE